MPHDGGREWPAPAFLTDVGVNADGILIDESTV
jgi:hypothetical protein